MISTLIPLTQLDFDKAKIRLALSPHKLALLTADIARNGLNQPLIVRPQLPADPVNPRYTIVNGERRCRAASAAGLQSVPCIIRDLSDQEALEWQLAENVQRCDLTAGERSRALRILREQLQEQNGSCNWEQLADQVGLSSRRIRQIRSLAELPPHLRDRFEAGELSMGHAILLRSLSDRPELQRSLIDECVLDENGRSPLSCHQLAARIRIAGVADRAENILQYEGLIFYNALRFGKPETWSPELQAVVQEIAALLDKLFKTAPSSTGGSNNSPRSGGVHGVSTGRAPRIPDFSASTRLTRIPQRTAGRDPPYAAL